MAPRRFRTSFGELSKKPCILPYFILLYAIYAHFFYFLFVISRRPTMPPGLSLPMPNHAAPPTWQGGQPATAPASCVLIYSLPHTPSMLRLHSRSTWRSVVRLRKPSAHGKSNHNTESRFGNLGGKCRITKSAQTVSLLSILNIQSHFLGPKENRKALKRKSCENIATTTRGQMQTAA